MAGTNELLEQFISDAEDLIDSSDEALIHLELREGNPEDIMASLMRALHTLKGTAAFFELPLLSSFAHYLEDMIQPFRGQDEFPDADTVVNMFSGITILRQIFEGLKEGRNEKEFQKEMEELKRQCQGKSGHEEMATRPVGTKETKPSNLGDAHSITCEKESVRGQDPLTSKPDNSNNKEHPPLCRNAPKEPKRPNVKRTSDPFLKVRSQKVDELMDLVAEFGVAVAEVLNHHELKGREIEGLEEKQHHVEVLLRQLQDIAASMRLVPVSTLFRPMLRLVRDLSRTTGKKLRLRTQGDETELDKVVVESLHDPLVHMIRNAGDHGIGTPEERRRSGKSEEGTILLKASQRGGEVVIEVIDDGKGLNREAILKKAKQQNLIHHDEIPPDNELWQYIFHPGFSTAEKVTSVSGRGVGMDVVNAAVKEVRGRIEIESTPGQGTRVAICIPLTLAFLDSMVVERQDIRYAIPTENVLEILSPQPDWIVKTSADNSEIVKVREELIPILRLEQFYQQEDQHDPREEQLLVIVRSERRPVAIPVDEVLGQQQVTIKPLQGHATDIKAGAGWALLGSGETALVLDCIRLDQSAA